MIDLRIIRFNFIKKSIKMHQADLIQRLKTRREQLSVTQEQLAELAAVALRTVKALDSGKGNPTVSTLIKLADVLGMELKLEVRKKPS
jgi:transcriptional regulator with XRE-family HTH domain